MSLTDPVTGYAIVLVFSTVLIGIGIYAAMGNRLGDFDDYAVTGRNVGIGLGIGTLFASWVTASTIIAAPQIAYQHGYLGSIGYAMGGIALVLFAPLAHRIRTLMPDGVTVTDFLLARYDRKNYYLFLLLFFTLIFMNGAQLPIGTGTILAVLFGIDYHAGLLVTTLPVLVYIIIGGMRSVVATDYLQSIAMILLLLIFVPLLLVIRSPTRITEGMRQADPATVQLTAPVGLLWVVSATMFLFGLVLMLNSFWQRIFSINDRSLTKAYTVAGISWASVPLLTGVFGYVAIAEGIEVENINQVVPLVVLELFPGIGVVTFVVLVFIAFSSSLDTRVNSMAVMVAHELYYKHFDPDASDDQMLRAARVATAVFGVFVLAIAWDQPGMIDIIVVLGPINAAYVPTFVLGAYWERTSADATFVATLTAATFAAYATLGPFFGVWRSPDLPIHTEYMTTVICFAISTTIIVIGSLLTTESFDFDQLADRTRRTEDVADD